ncbi:MAG: rhodanese-like domain-containing protein [Chloroflexi bacterium]|nr:rhodanese-like domain-containing protein [Chloroflexota bacterium]
MTTDVSDKIRRLTPVEVSAEIARGATPLDIRESSDFGPAHMKGAINIQYSSKKFAERVTALIPAGIPLLVVGKEDAQAIEACTALMANHQIDVVGYLAGGIDSWQAADMPTASLAQISIHDLLGRLEAHEPGLTLLDVRESFEWEELGYVEGAVLISLGAVEKRREELPTGGILAIVCEHGLRSSTAASILSCHGFSRLLNVAEGMAGWRSAGYPLIEQTS